MGPNFYPWATSPFFGPLMTLAIKGRINDSFHQLNSSVHLPSECCLKKPNQLSGEKEKKSPQKVKQTSPSISRGSEWTFFHMKKHFSSQCLWIEQLAGERWGNDWLVLREGTCETRVKSSAPRTFYRAIYWLLARRQMTQLISKSIFGWRGSNWCNKSMYTQTCQWTMRDEGSSINWSVWCHFVQGIWWLLPFVYLACNTHSRLQLWTRVLSPSLSHSPSHLRRRTSNGMTLRFSRFELAGCMLWCLQLPVLHLKLPVNPRVEAAKKEQNSSRCSVRGEKSHFFFKFMHRRLWPFFSHFFCQNQSTSHSLYHSWEESRGQTVLLFSVQEMI